MNELFKTTIFGSGDVPGCDMDHPYDKAAKAKGTRIPELSKPDSKMETYQRYLPIIRFCPGH